MTSKRNDKQKDRQQQRQTAERVPVRSDILDEKHSRGQKRFAAAPCVGPSALGFSGARTWAFGPGWYIARFQRLRRWPNGRNAGILRCAQNDNPEVSMSREARMTSAA